MAKLNVIDLEGQGLGEIEVADEEFATEVKEHLLWEVVRWQRAKRRAGTAKTKERWEINATGAKMYKQKGTGNARHHSRRPNIFRGGGQVFGPRPRSYEFDVNKKVRSSALRSALSLRAAAGNLLVVRDFTVPESKTRNLHRALTKLDAIKSLLVDVETNESLRLDRDKARGMRLDIAAGTAVRFEPGQRREVTLVPYGGTRTVYGFQGKVMGKL